MEKFTRLTPEQRTDLVAYLDGELDETAAQEIEQVLSKSEVARHEVDGLALTYDLLDSLPKATASEAFTRNTISKLQAVNQSQPLLRDRAWFRPARRGVVAVLWVAGLAAGAYLGYAATHRWMPNETDQLLNELPLIEKYDQYTDVGDVEFLIQLKKQGSLGPRDAQPNP